MNKIAVIMPYFGKMPNYFDLWLQSCHANSQIDWIIVTDNLIKHDFNNIKIINIVNIIVNFFIFITCI